MKKILLILLLASTAITGCKKDKEKATIVGDWKLSSVRTTTYDSNGKLVNESTTNTELELSFDDNGMMTEKGSDYYGSAPYSLSNNKLTMGEDVVAFKWMNNNQFMTTRQDIDSSAEGNNNKIIAELIFERN